MSTTRSSQERQQAQEVARRLRAEGWDVSETPPASNLPQTLRNFSPDLLATRGDQHLIVEVKSLRTRPAEDDRLDAMATAISALPHWDLRLVWIGEQELPQESLVLNKWADGARALLQTQPEAALLLAWSAVEGSLARRAEDAGVSPRLLGNALVNELYSQGATSDEEFDLLKRAYRLRSALAHGRQGEPVDPNFVRRLLEIFVPATSA